MPRGNEPTECGYLKVSYRSSELAICVFDDDGSYWIPKSQICEESEITKDSEEGDEGELVLPEWLAIEKDFV